MEASGTSDVQTKCAPSLAVDGTGTSDDVQTKCIPSPAIESTGTSDDVQTKCIPSPAIESTGTSDDVQTKCIPSPAIESTGTSDDVQTKCIPFPAIDSTGTFDDVQTKCIPSPAIESIGTSDDVQAKYIPSPAIGSTGKSDDVQTKCTSSLAIESTEPRKEVAERPPVIAKPMQVCTKSDETTQEKIKSIECEKAGSHGKIEMQETDSKSTQCKISQFKRPMVNYMGSAGLFGKIKKQNVASSVACGSNLIAADSEISLQPNVLSEDDLNCFRKKCEIISKIAAQRKDKTKMVFDLNKTNRENAIAIMSSITERQRILSEGKKHHDELDRSSMIVTTFSEEERRHLASAEFLEESNENNSKSMAFPNQSIAEFSEIPKEEPDSSSGIEFLVDVSSCHVPSEASCDSVDAVPESK